MKGRITVKMNELNNSVEPTFKALGNLIKAHRKEKNITISILAEQVGKSQSMISQMEKGTRGGSDDILEKIAFCLGLDPKELIQLKDITKSRSKNVKNGEHPSSQNGVQPLPVNNTNVNKVVPVTTVNRNNVQTAPEYPQYIHSFVQFLLTLEKNYCQDLIKEFTEQAKFKNLTPFDLGEIKQMVLNIRKSWYDISSNLDEIAVLFKRKEGYFRTPNENCYVDMELDEFAFTLTLLSTDKTHVNSFKESLFIYTISYETTQHTSHLNGEQAVIRYIWFSPQVSTSQKYHYLIERGYPLNRVECNEALLQWFIMQQMNANNHTQTSS